ncbi:MAG TPA: GTPase ObgE [Patescibacteria group bacterium]|jgi:GTP-binding protein|nr:GTPase ObgE [Patescibacteria group bacterium]
MLIDEATITVKAGNGGNGRASFKRNAQTAKGGPDGGNGGNGGSVYAQGIDDIMALVEFRYKKSVRGEDGVGGGKQNLYGRNGKDLIVYFPIGTFITDLSTKETFEILDTSTKVLLAKGGKGGRGNNEFKTATNQTPYYAEKGEPGEEKRFFLELKLIADVGLIGLPNSGKSSLLDALTNAHPKIGNYPFTTLEPNLGVMPAPRSLGGVGNGLIIADIPGLIEGASEGRGLGDKFLRHVEKTKVLIHCLDLQSEDLVKDYQTVRKELKEYTSDLTVKNELLVLTKADLVAPDEIKKVLKTVNKLNANNLVVSVYDDKSLAELKAKILALTQK